MKFYILHTQKNGAHYPTEHKHCFYFADSPSNALKQYLNDRGTAAAILGDSAYNDRGERLDRYEGQESVEHDGTTHFFKEEVVEEEIS